jgi:DNA-binding ferritin-like protein (Dps family)
MLEAVYVSGEKMREAAKERAEEEYKARFDALSADYQQRFLSLDKEY